MTDLTFCYLHMTRQDLLVLDTYDTADFIAGELSDEEVDVLPHLKPPNPEDADVLPSRIHPSYPYGNPLHLRHPASRPRVPHDPTSRALFQDMGFAKGGVNGNLLWQDLALDTLLPIDEEKEIAERAARARNMASGAAPNQNPQQPHAQGMIPGAGMQTVDEDDEDDDDDDEDEDEEEENDENDEESNDENMGDSSSYDEDDE